MSQGGLLPAATRVSEVALTVADLASSRDFYTRALGLELVEEAGGDLRLGAGSDAFLRLVHDPDASPSRGAVGLYHFAILYPSRPALADAARRFLDARGSLQGAADHLVSEALYLADPEGNGIELYRDRARERWPRLGGQIQMDTLPLDVAALLREAAGGSAAPAPPGTTLGHVHLQVRDLDEAERFYSEVVGLERVLRYGGSASFLAAGGYHHHLGINSWGTAGADAASEGALGLRWYLLSLPDAGALAALRRRIQDAGEPCEEHDGGLRFRDPSGHRVVAVVA